MPMSRESLCYSFQKRQDPPGRLEWGFPIWRESNKNELNLVVQNIRRSIFVFYNEMSKFNNTKLCYIAVKRCILHI